MSELKMIIDQAVEEMGGWNDAAIDRWSELSGVDIRAIDENTPFDIDTANKLLATFPQVLEALKSTAAPGPQEPSPDEVIGELSEIAESLGEALGMGEEAKTEDIFPEESLPEVDIETGVAPEAPEAPETPPEPEAQPEPVPETPTSADSSIDALLKELDSLTAGIGEARAEVADISGAPVFEEGGVPSGPEAPEAPGEAPGEAEPPVSAEAGPLPEGITAEAPEIPAEIPERIEAEAPGEGITAEAPEEIKAEIPEAPEIPAEIPERIEAEAPGEGITAEAPEEIKAEIPEAPEVPEAEPVPEKIEAEAPAEPAEAPPIEIPAPVAEELAEATRIMEEIEAPEYDLVALEKRVPGFQAACVIDNGKVIARHAIRDIDWTALAEPMFSANAIFKEAFGIEEKHWEEMVVGLGNLFILGFVVKGVQVVVVVKSDRLGAARAYVHAALKDL